MVPCDNVPDIRNGERRPTEDSVTCGTKVRYTCNQGFTLKGDVLECGVGRQLMGQLPVCKRPGNYFLVNANNGNFPNYLETNSVDSTESNRGFPPWIRIL